MSDVIRIEDAKALKKMGAPLNTTVTDGGELPERFSKLISSVLKAATACRSAVFVYIDNQNASTYAALKRKHQKLGREIAKVPKPIWIDEPDGVKRLTNPEDTIVEAIVGPRCFTAFQQWTEIIGTLENGQQVEGTFRPWPTETDE